MNNDTKNYKIKFLQGEYKERVFAISDEKLVIGRSETADIQLDCDDITLAITDANQLELNINDNKNIFVNDDEVEQNIILNLQDTINICDNDIFILLENDDNLGELPTVSTPEDDNEDITEDATADSDDVISEALSIDENSTRYASELELAELRKYNQSQIIKRKLVLFLGVLICLFIVGSAILMSNLRVEKNLTWPGEVDNNYNDGEFRIEINGSGKCMIYYPQTDMTVVNENGLNCEIMTALGRDKNVPYHITLEVRDVENGFRVTREASFSNWFKEISQNSNFYFYERKSQNFYNQKECGYPYFKLYYSRSDTNLTWQGIASYMRYQDKELILRREVPTEHFMRAEKVLESYGSFVVSKEMVNSYWEIPEVINNYNPTRLLQRVSAELYRNISTVSWKDIDGNLRSLLCVAYENKDQVLINSVTPLWKDFRRRQNIWYSRACLAYQTYQQSEDRQGMKNIVNDCLEHFNSPNDYRHIRIIKNIWTIEK